MSASVLTRHAREIWSAGVAAVDPHRLIAQHLQRDGDTLTVCGRTFDLRDWRRIVVVGAGKAGAGMAAAVEDVLGPDLCRDRVSGLINVPADCVRDLTTIHLHPARPAGVNEPTAEGVYGTRQILDLVRNCDEHDLCLVLLSGGGSALAPAPVDGITLADKQDVTRTLMRTGATINELNCVRKQLSAFKGGGLARASRAGSTVALIISDVVGDPLDVIASGPTVPDTSTPQQALDILRRKYGDESAIPPAVLDVLRRKCEQTTAAAFPETIVNTVIGSNRVALDTAAAAARERGYHVHSLGSENESTADEQGRLLTDLARHVRDAGEPVAPPACLLSGGEPTVTLVPTDRPRKGGRNQQLALAALIELQSRGGEGIVLLSGGTDGEDGPTDAAGAFVDADVLQRTAELGLDAADYLGIQNAYAFFDQTGGLLKTGPTGTNVMDLRVVLIADRPRSDD